MEQQRYINPNDNQQRTIWIKPLAADNVAIPYGINVGKS